jgi:hypothetical protein
MLPARRNIAPIRILEWISRVLDLTSVIVDLQIHAPVIKLEKPFAILLITATMKTFEVECYYSAYCYAAGSKKLECQQGALLTCQGRNNELMDCFWSGYCSSERTATSGCRIADECIVFPYFKENNYGENLRFISKQVTIGNVSFGKTRIGYAIADADLPYSPAPVIMKSLSSIYASDTNPGDGWIGLGAIKDSAPGSYTLYWKNLKSDSFGKWTIDLSNSSSLQYGSSKSQSSVSRSGYNSFEEKVKMDLDGDGCDHWPSFFW